VSSALAVARGSPSPAIRNGKPQISANTVPVNCVVKCDQMPSRVPGCRHAPASSRPTRAKVIAAPDRIRRSGVSRNAAIATMAETIPAQAVDRKAVVHPGPARRAANGTAESTCPNCPTMPVSWVTTGTRRAGNHCGTRRSTLRNVIASPAPTRTRATTAPVTPSANASSTWPLAITSAPVTTRRTDPNRSSSMPTGTCSPA